MVYWTLRAFVCTRWLVRLRRINFAVAVGESASVLGDRRVCVKVTYV